MKQSSSTAIDNLVEDWERGASSNSWVTKRRPDDDAIYALFTDSFRGTDQRIGEPFVQWLLQTTLPADQLEDDVFWKVLTALTVDDAMAHGAKNGVFVGKKQQSDEEGEGDRSAKLQGGIALLECDKIQEKTWWVKIWNNCKMMMLYLKLRSRYGPVDLMESREYQSEREHFMQLGDSMSDELLQCRMAHGPHEPHWYIKMVGIHPGAQGQGLGKQLMGKLHQAADANGRACYLETAGERNICFYQKLGYDVVGEIVLKDPNKPSYPAFEGVAMVRQPQSLQP